MKRPRIFAIASLLVIVPFLMMRQRDDVQAANRIAAAYRKAEAPMMQAGATPDDAEKFGLDLRAIDLTDADPEVQQAMVRLIDTVDAANFAQRGGGDTNTTFEAVTYARNQLMRTLDRSRGQPY